MNSFLISLALMAVPRILTGRLILKKLILNVDMQNNRVKEFIIGIVEYGGVCRAE